jgi:hypothetical protein
LLAIDARLHGGSDLWTSPAITDRFASRLSPVAGPGESRDASAAWIEQLSRRLTARFGRGFGPVNLWQMRALYLTYAEILQTASEESGSRRSGKILQTASGESDLLASVSAKLPLPWSHYVKLLSLKNDLARRFYEAEAFRGGWTVRQLDRQIQTKFYERTLLSRSKRAMLTKGEVPRAEDEVSPEAEIKDPFVLEFLGLKDEYSETELEDALIHDLRSRRRCTMPSSPRSSN